MVLFRFIERRIMKPIKIPFQSHNIAHHRNTQWQSHKYTLLLSEIES